jgi:hypothetical protein
MLHQRQLGLKTLSLLFSWAHRKASSFAWPFGAEFSLLPVWAELEQTASSMGARCEAVLQQQKIKQI